MPAQPPDAPRAGPPPLRPFGLRLHHDGRWTHDGAPIANRKLRELFDRSVRFLPEEAKYVVQLRHFRGEIEVEEAAFFVRTFDAATARIMLSDGSDEPLAVASLAPSPRDGALLCRVKRQLARGGLVARFDHSAQAEFMNAIDERGEAIAICGSFVALPKTIT